MRHAGTKYEKLYEYIDQLSASTVFSYKSLGEAVGFKVEPKPILPLLREGLLERVERVSIQKFFRKSEKWCKKRAIDINYKRLVAKWQRYKPKAAKEE